MADLATPGPDGATPNPAAPGANQAKQPMMYICGGIKDQSTSQSIKFPQVELQVYFLQSATKRTRYDHVILFDAESVVTEFCTRREPKEVNFVSTSCSI